MFLMHDISYITPLQIKNGESTIVLSKF